MALPSSFFRDDFQLKENHFALPENSINLDTLKKRTLTICNLFVNHNMSISNIQRVLDEDQPEIASFREPLKNIVSHGRHALDSIARIRPKSVP